MALILADRVQETTATAGTGTVTLAGAVNGYQSFAVIGNSNTTYYTITSGTAWEVGIGTYTALGTTLARTTVLASSAGGTTLITLAGTSNVFVTYPSGKAISDGYGTLPVVNGGTGATVAATALTNLGAYPSANPSGYTSNVGTVTSVTATAGTGISVTGSPITGSGTLTIANTAPDQTVALTQGGTTTITGTYPNFTISSADQFSGTVTSVTGTSPVVSSGGATPAISMAAATSLVNGYLTSADWTTFNNKGSGSVTSVGGTGTVNGLTLSGTVTTAGNLTLGGALDVPAAHITLARMASVLTGTVFYRKTAATGVPEVQTLATLKTDLGLTGTNSGDQSLASYALLASPALTGVPSAPTAAAGTNTTQLATTAFVFASSALQATLTGATFSGVVSGPTAAAGTNTTQLATTAHVFAADALQATLTGATFSGVVSGPTAAAGTNTTQLATTAHVFAADALQATLTGATFSGIVNGPTAAAGTKTTQLATTAFVLTPGIQSVASAASVTPTFSNDQVNITAQAVALTLANPTGTAQDGWGMVIRIKDNATARTIAYGTNYRAIGVTLPATTVISKTLYLGMIYNAADTKWDVTAVAQEA